MARLPQLSGIPLRDFSGGPNLRDTAPTLADNECVDAWNVTFDERGGVQSRLGSAKYNGVVYDAAALVKNVFDWQAGNTIITQVGAKLYKGTSTTVYKTFTTAARVGFAEMLGVLIVGHPVDGLFTSTDGQTYTAVADPDAPKGNALEVWQNRLLVAGQGTSKVSASDAGSVTAWTATSFNNLREKDDEPVVALKSSSGVDISGRPGLLAFKSESAYRIFNATTLDYQTIDATVGAASALAVVNVGGKTITLSKRGIFWTDGLSPMRDASDRFHPLWTDDELAFAQQDLWCAGRRGNRAYFSLTRAGATVNNLALEYHPDQGWVAPGSNAVSCYTTFTADTETLYGGSPTVNGQVYKLMSGGTDDGAAISWRFQTRWLEPNRGFQDTVWQIRLHGRGSGTMTVLKDYASSGGDAYPFSYTTSTPVFDTAVFDTAVFNDPALQATVPTYGVGLCRQIGLKFTGSSSTTVSGSPLLGAGSGQTVGAFALGGIDVLHVSLGIS